MKHDENNGWKVISKIMTFKRVKVLTTMPSLD